MSHFFFVLHLDCKFKLQKNLACIGCCLFGGFRLIITIFLGISIAQNLQAEEFLKLETIIVLLLGLFAFVFDTFGGVMLAKFINIFAKNKINPMIGATGISAFPMSARVVHKMGLEEDSQNFLLMHTIGVNVSGQIASVIAGGLILSLVPAIM